LDAFAAARKLSDAGSPDKAADQLAKAVELSPYYSEAWINLGAEHLYLRRFDLALQELKRATGIAPPSAVLLSNLAFAQYALGLNDEGTRSVREALRLDPSYAKGHYLLGAYLARGGPTRAEGIAHLEKAARELKSAREELERARRGLL
jgi:tetratricopeptide (TPR) repeat protein